MAVTTLTSRVLNISKHLTLKILCNQQSILVRNIQNQGEYVNDEKKTKRNIPKITLISTDNILVTTLEEAQKLSKRRDLKLVKVIDLDTKSQRPVYKLMTGNEYHAEELKQREQKKKDKENDNSLKGEKVLMLNANIGVNDLNVAANKIIKWLNKRYETRVIINGNAGNMEKAVSIS